MDVERRGILLCRDSHKSLVYYLEVYNHKNRRFLFGKYCFFFLKLFRLTIMASRSGVAMKHFTFFKIPTLYHSGSLNARKTLQIPPIILLALLCLRLIMEIN